MQSSKRQYLLPVLAAVVANIFWGFSYLLIRIALGVSSPEIMLSIRFIIAFVLINVIMVVKGQRIRLRGRRYLLPLSILVIGEPLGYFLESYGVLYTNATLSGIILAIVPIFAIGAAALFLKEYPTLRQLLLSFIPVAGVILITISGNEIGIAKPIGILCLAGACMCYATYRTANRKASQEFDAMERTYMILASSMIVFTIAALLQVKGDMRAYLAPLSDMHFLIPVLLLSVFCSIFSNIFANYAAQKLTVLQYSVIGTTSTICSTFGGVIFLHEPMTGMMLMGACMILFGIRMVNAAQRKEEAQTE